MNNFNEIKLFKAHEKCVNFLLLVHETKLISGSVDRKIKLWSLKSFDLIQVFEGHLDTIYNLELNSKGCLVLSCSEDKTVKIWQTETGELLKSIEFDHPVNCTQLLNDQLLSVALENGHIVIFDLNKMEQIYFISAHLSYVYHLRFISNGNLLSGCGKGKINLWKVLD